MIEDKNIKQCITQDKKSESTKTNPLFMVKTSIIPTKIEIAEDKSKSIPTKD
ncbi:hypothetical protein [Clostridium estertheticum]|uniref:hypothetical protein n=1 Tax=Clostridium estertheticum TaxID=238834 RepID=UPI001C7DA396|nr:hypothetical protein [Clostridium estertheticum]MBX4268898.1 hypothetical protein [Clostridium estertheticum]WLC78909.1 hypothetical protein KTC98_17190 [Clostridium estertheticum]